MQFLEVYVGLGAVIAGLGLNAHAWAWGQGLVQKSVTIRKGLEARS
jgi:hypothetical protein